MVYILTVKLLLERSGLDINLYKSLNRTTDKFDAVFSDIYPNATNLNERKELLLFYANKLTTEETEKNIIV